MFWEVSDVSRITVLNTANLNEPLMLASDYTVRLTAVTDTTMTSTLSRTAEDGITVSCIDPLPTMITLGSTTINLVGEEFSCKNYAQNFFPYRSTRTTFHHVSLYWE